VVFQHSVDRSPAERSCVKALLAGMCDKVHRLPLFDRESKCIRTFVAHTHAHTHTHTHTHTHAGCPSSQSSPSTPSRNCNYPLSPFNFATFWHCKA
jgi:hypothetical protein